MNSTRIKRTGILLGFCALLAFGLAGCGGDEAAPAAVTPPAPPPAPPPFQPQAVEVALGASGESVTLMTTEAGGFTRDGAAFASGAEVTAANGNGYTLTLADGSWSAAYNAVEVPVALGASGETVTLTSLEAGGFALPDGTAVGADSTWMSSTGGTYAVTLGADGQPAAAFAPATVTVPLGAFGGSLALLLQEDGATYLDPDGAVVRSGDTVVRGANSYVLTFAGGAWSAAYQPVTAAVALGASGSSTELTRAEDGSWWIGEALFVSGGTVTAANGDAYALTVAGGVWSAAFQAATVPIDGTGLTAATREGGGGYDVGGQTLGADGGDVTVAGASYHVTATADGGLAGARFDAPIESRVFRQAVGFDSGVTPSLSRDDRGTPADETGTLLQAGGAKFSIGELLNSGAAGASGPNIVAGARAKLAALRARAAALVGLFDGGGIERSQLSTLLGNLWDEADAEIDKIVDGGHQLERDTNPRRVVDALQAVVDALADEDAFVAATASGGGGVLAQASLAAAKARTTFGRSKWTASASFGAVGDTRFGVVLRSESPDAERNPAVVAREAFAWSTIDATQRLADVRAEGSASYSGRTVAIDSASKMYAGDIELQVSFVRAQVNGLVTNLAQSNGEAWKQGLGGEVEAIFLPTADIVRTGRWNARSGDARLSYAAFAGGSPDVTVGGSSFQGQLLGRGEDAGSQAAGVWSVGDLLAGGFGAERGADGPDGPGGSGGPGGTGPGSNLVNDVTTVGASDPFTVKASFGKAWFNKDVLMLDDLVRFTVPSFPADVDFKIPLARLFGDGYAPTSTDPDALVAQHEVPSGEILRVQALEIIQEQRDFLESWVKVYGPDSGGLQLGTRDSPARGNGQPWTRRDEALNLIAQAIDGRLLGTPGFTNNDPREGTAGARILTDDATTFWPKTAGGRFADSTMLARIDAVIEALSDRSAFDAAFEDGGVFDGFYRDSTPNDPSDDVRYGRGQPLDVLWGKEANRVLLWTDRTQYARLGVWARQESESASHNHHEGVNTVRALPPSGTNVHWYYRESEPFVYSPLGPSTFGSADAQGYPAGALASYSGSSVAFQSEITYRGRVEARVRWNQDSVGGEMRIKLIELRSTDPNYGLIRHGLNDHFEDSTGTLTKQRPGTQDVRSITFQADITTNADNELVIAGKPNSVLDIEYNTVDGKVAPWIDTVNLDSDNKIQYWSGYTYADSSQTSGPVDGVDDLVLGGSQAELNIYVAQNTPTPNPPTGTVLSTPYTPLGSRTGLRGSFVGQDGPQGFIALWTIGNEGGSHYLGLGNTLNSGSAIRGSIGADIVP